MRDPGSDTPAAAEDFARGPRAAVYVRVSTEEQVQSGTSLEDQWRLGAAFARNLGASEISLYADPGVSGASLRRPSLDRLLKDLRDHRIDVVIATDPDRLSRRLVHQLLLTEEISRYGELRFVHFHWQDTPDGRLFYALRGAIAEFERERIRERTHTGRIATARQGRIATAPHQAYGYVYQRATHSLNIDPPEAAVVLEIYRRYVESLQGPDGIASELGRMGIPTRMGRTWHGETVRRILRNPIYRGRLRQLGGQSVPVPAIVPVDLWEDAQRRAERLRRVPPGHAFSASGTSGPSAPPLLTGLAYCGFCSSPLVVHTLGRRGAQRRTYVCRRRRRPSHLPGAAARDAPCRMARYDATLLERAVLAGIAASLDKAPGGDGALPRVLPAAFPSVLPSVAQVSLKRAREGILRLYRRGAVTEAEAETELQAIGSIQSLTRCPPGPSLPMALSASPAPGPPAAAANSRWDDTHSVTTRRSLEALGIRVTVGPQHRIDIRVEDS